MADAESSRARLGRPSLDAFVFSGEEVPWLLRGRVAATIAICFALLLGGAFVATRVLGLPLQIDAEPFREWVAGWGAWGPVVFVAVMALSVLFAPIPNVPIFIAAGVAWGPVVGTAYSLSGLVLGSAMAFYVARALGRRHLARLVGSKAAERLDNIADTMGGTVIFWSRMLPAINFDWISFVAGMTSIRFRTFIVYSALGMVIPTAMSVAAGDGLSHDFRITALMGGLWVAGIVASATFFWFRRRRVRRPAADTSTTQ